MPHNEEYLVKINYQMQDGYWKVGHEEIVSVPIKDWAKEKDNHGEAEKLMKEKYPGCKIVSVTYA